MTSKQIRTWIESNKPVSESRALWELAYQQAILNERNAEIDRYNAEAHAEDSATRSDNMQRLMAAVEQLSSRLDAMGAPGPIIQPEKPPQ